MAKVEIYNVGAVGVVKDSPSHYLPPEAWTDANNMRFQDNIAMKMTGHEAVFDPPSVAPSFLMNVPTSSSVYWLYASLTKAYVYESGTHTNITRQSAGVDVDYTVTLPRDWNGGVLGGIPILNNGIDLPQYWGAVSAGTKLANLTNFPSTLRCKILRPYGPFLVALNINDNGTLYPHMYWWSHPADPGALPLSWDYTNADYDAGRKELTDVEGGHILDALMLRNMLIVYKETSTHYIRYVGGQEILQSDLLWPNSGILWSRCVALVNRGTEHFVATADDVVAHNGQQIRSLLDAKARRFLRNDLDVTNFRNSFCVDNPSQREAWFCYPSSGAEYPNKVLIWNYAYNTIQFRDFSGNCAAAGTVADTSAAAWSALSGTWASVTDRWSEEGKRQLLIGDRANTKIFKADATETFNGSLMSCYLERTGLAIIGRDRQGQPKADYSSRKLCKRIWPKISGDSRVNIRLGAQEDVKDDVTWSAAQTFDPATQKYLDFTVNGRFLAVRFESQTSDFWQLEGYDLDIEVLGEQ